MSAVVKSTTPPRGACADECRGAQTPTDAHRVRPVLTGAAAVDVAVIGAGIAGSALAIALRDIGLTVALIERQRHFVDRIRGDGLAPWGVAEAARLGLLEVFAAAGARERRYWDTWEAGERRRRDELAELDPHGRGVLTFRNHLVQTALLEHAAAAGVRIVRGAPLQETRHTRSRWQALVGGLWLHAGLLVRADGRSGSTCRTGVCSDARTHSVTGTILRCPQLDQAAVATARVPGGRLLLFPIGAGLVRIYYMSPARVTRSRDRGQMRGLLLRELASALPHASRGVRFEGALGSFSNACAWPERLCGPEFCRVGDAAGTSDPSIGQGVALALRDARELRDLFAASGERHQVLAEYSARRARYFAVQRMVAWASWVADQPGVLGAATRAALRRHCDGARNEILHAVRADPLRVSPDRQTAARLIGLDYPKSSLIRRIRWLDFQAPLRAAFDAHAERKESA